jgi:sulfoxide reductase heme-binding subunit YedZ
MALRRILASRWTKVPVFALCLVPALLLAWRALNGDLSANPIEFITHWTGDWTIRFLCITLSITPLRKLSRLPELIRFRRMLGLFGFF